MAVEPIRPHIERESWAKPTLEQPEIIDALRHGNIYEVLRTPGINRRDIEDYLAGQSKLLQNQILQDYQIYASEAIVPTPDLEEHFPVHAKEMFLDSQDRGEFRQDMQFLQAYQPEIYLSDGGKSKIQFKAMRAEAKGLELPQGEGQDVAAIAEKAINDWGNFFSDLQTRVIDAQMWRDLQGKTAELNRDVQRILALVMSGQVEPEYVLIAAAKSNMLQNGTFFSWKGKRIMHLNDEMNKSSKDLLKMNPNDQGYVKEVQMAQMKTRSGSTQMQMELMDIQKFAQNIATTLDWVNNAVRVFAQMRQTPTQAIQAR